MDIEQLYGAPGGGYIIFTDWGADYPLPGIQEYHKWSDLHLVDTFAIFGDSVCISLFMDSVAMNCVVIPGIEGICLDTFYINPGDSLVLVECDNDTTFFAGGGVESQGLTIEGAGPTYDIAIDGGTDVTIQGAGITLTESPANTLIFTADDPSATNEIQTLDASGTGPIITLDLSSDASDPTITGAGTVAITATGNAITVTGTADGDGSATNELQTLATTSDATSNTTTLSNSGGSQKLIEGTGITLTTGVTGLNGEVTIASTIVDTDTDDQGLTITGVASPFTIDIDNGSDVAIASGTNVTLTESPANQLNIAVADEAIQDVAGAMFTGNTETGVSVTYQDADGTIDVVATDDSATNEAWTIDADDADTEVISNQTVIFEGLSGITTNYVPATNTLEIELTGGGGDGNGMWTASNDNTNIANGTFEVGVTGYLDFRDGSEHDLYIDAANDRIGMGTNGPSYGLHVRNDAGMAVESFSDDVAMIFKVEGTAEGTGADTTMASILLSYTDSDHAGGVEQTATDMGIFKYSDTGQRTAFKIRMLENTDADAIVIEKEAALSGNHQESLVSINGGFANTQNYEWTATGADLTIDRGYFGVIVSGAGALGDEILLPNVFANGDNWKSTMTATDCQIGQEYYITNLRASTALVVRTNSGDFFRASATTVSIPAGFTLHVRCTRLNGTTGVWASWLSD